MLTVGLTGGYGTGKSTVTKMLAAHGAIVIDADILAREVVEPGTPGFAEVVEYFGSEALHSNGRLDRHALAEIVFSDAIKRAKLNEIIHPRVFDRMVGEVAEWAEAGGVVILDIPLLFESGTRGPEMVQRIVVVSSSEENALKRLATKGVNEQDARARIAAQMPLSEKVALADHVLHNDGTQEELQAQVDSLWTELEAAVPA